MQVTIDSPSRLGCMKRTSGTVASADLRCVLQVRVDVHQCVCVRRARAEAATKIIDKATIPGEITSEFLKTYDVYKVEYTIFSYGVRPASLLQDLAFNQ